MERKYETTIAQRTLRMVYSLISNGEHEEAKRLILPEIRHVPLRLVSPNKGYLLHFAILKGSYEIIEYLLDGGADIELKMTGQTPFLYAASRRKLKMCELLFRRGANIDAGGCRGLTSLHYAVLTQNVPLVQFLLLAGAQDLKDNYGRTALDYANKEMALLFEKKH